MPWASACWNVAVSESLGLHFQIDLCVNMSSVQGHVSEPATDRVDVNTCTEQVTGGRMTNRMRTDAFGFERRYRRARLPHRSSYQGVDTKPSQRLSETVQEHSFVRTTAAHQSLEQAGSLGPQRTVPNLVAFAY
jgi:hypothetical protein